MRLRILFDNVPGREGTRPLWGFACLVETEGRRWLFDTGSNGRWLMRNAEALGESLRGLDAMVISHPHWDHTGGIDTVLEESPGIRCYLPASLSPRYIRDIDGLSAGAEVIGEAPRRLFAEVWSTGVMGEAGEQSVVIAGEDSAVVPTGCAHPGIAAIARRAVEMTGRPIRLLMGGFHLMNAGDPEILATIEALERLEIGHFCPTHCTGKRATELFRERFGERVFAGGAGRSFELEL